MKQQSVDEMVLAGRTLAEVKAAGFTDKQIILSTYGTNLYKVGDTVTLSMGHKPASSSGNVTFKQVEFDVIGKNHDVLNTITLCCKNILQQEQWHATDVNNYKTSDIRTRLIAMVNNGDRVPDLTDVYYFDEKITNTIKAVPKLCHNAQAPITSTDKVWLLSCDEVGFADQQPEGKPYEFFTSNDKRIKKFGENALFWWLRTPHFRGLSSAYGVAASGSSDYDKCSNVYGLVFGFCLPVTPAKPAIQSFTVNNVSYQFEDGMTWEQFVNSKYNPNNYFAINYNCVVYDNMNFAPQFLKRLIAPTQKIRATIYGKGPAPSDNVSHKISFKIDGASYSAEYGMTFEQWVHSSYNIDGYMDKESSVEIADVGGYRVLDNDINTPLYKKNKIEPDAEYPKETRALGLSDGIRTPEPLKMDNGTYLFINTMSWWDWVDSEYNTLGLEINGINGVLQQEIGSDKCLTDEKSLHIYYTNYIDYSTTHKITLPQDISAGGD